MTNPDREELVKFDLFTPDELAVRLDEWANCLDKAQMDLRSDLRCAAIHLRRLASSDGGVKVRELEWVERTGVAGTFDASTSVGHYIATITDDGRGMWFIIGLTTSNYTIGDIDVVRAAAQADYEARIRSALVEVPAVKGEPEPVAWRPVPGFESNYEASNDGRVRSVSSGRELSTSSLAGSGYVKAELWKNNVRKQTYLHRVIAETFLGSPPDDKAEVNHIDGNKRNNAASNLEWSSRSENVRHSMYSLGNNVKPVVATDPDTLQEERYRSIEEAGRLGYCATSIYRCLTGERALHAGKTWRLDTAPPADAGMREAFVRVLASLAAAISILERTPKAKKAVASDKMFDTMLDDYRKALEAGRQALTAPGATTKSDGGEEWPASNPLSEVTHRPSDPKTSPELLALLERAKSHVMTPEDVYEQRRSFVRGMCPSDRDYTEWCADVDRIIPPLAGPSDTRPADVTVTPRVIDNDRDEIVVTLNGNELRGWSYSTEQERRVKMLCAREFVEGFHAGRQP